MHLLSILSARRLVYGTLFGQSGGPAVSLRRRLAFALSARAPRTLKLHLNDACNQSCPGCYRPGGTETPASTAQLSEARVVRLVEQIRAPGTRLDILGGEPVLHPGLPRVIAHARESRFIDRTFLYTNGTLISPDLARELAAAGLHTALVSLHGPGPEIHDQVVGRTGSWEEGVAGVNALCGAGVRSYLYIVVSSANLRHLEAMASLSAELGVGIITFPYIAQRPDDPLALEGEGQMRRAVSWSVANSYIFQRELAAAQTRGRRLCRAFTDTISIAPDGVVSPCPFMKLPLGNIHDAPLERIIRRGWRDPALRRFLALPRQCRGCVLAGICGGGCKARRYTLSGDPGGRDPHCTRGPFLEPIRPGEYGDYLPYIA